MKQRVGFFWPSCCLGILHTHTHILALTTLVGTHALSTEHSPSQLLTEASSHLIGPAPTVILKPTSTWVCIHWGHPLAGLQALNYS